MNGVPGIVLAVIILVVLAWLATGLPGVAGPLLP